MRSDRFYWCVGCGRWHDPANDKAMHFAMYCPIQEPSASNFDGTAEELQRFLVARKLELQDSKAFERRIDDYLTGINYE